MALVSLSTILSHIVCSVVIQAELSHFKLRWIVALFLDLRKLTKSILSFTRGNDWQCISRYIYAVLQLLSLSLSMDVSLRDPRIRIQTPSDRVSSHPVDSSAQSAKSHSTLARGNAVGQLAERSSIGLGQCSWAAG
uniref:Uncharacterized protein n=1 Tax=Mucochytrium quahogii TaxID=96639 RepID=A0A7S2SGS5_9STRA